ncbi:salicylate carboxymethyltransferase [Ranunculus cassubicifolius]
MDVEKVFHMKEGVGEKSYANNSSLQKTVISRAKPFVQYAIADLYCNTLPECLTIADLGCSSGPNSLFIISEILKTVNTLRKILKLPSPEFQVFLNDLPGNDFNTIFGSTPYFYEKLKKENGEDFGPCFVSGVPGSFYGRLFPTNSLNFVHSSYSLHWLSKVGSHNIQRKIFRIRLPKPNNHFGILGTMRF